MCQYLLDSNVSLVLDTHFVCLTVPEPRVMKACAGVNVLDGRSGPFNFYIRVSGENVLNLRFVK